jgi:hypothetical protein
MRSKMGSSVSKVIMDIILNIAVAILDDILNGLADVPGFRKWIDNRVLGDPQGDYTQIYHKSINDVINHFYSVHGYQYNGDMSTPPHAIDSTIFGFEDFCLYDPNNQSASNMSGYITDAFTLKGIDSTDVSKMTNAIVGDIRQMYANQNTNWQYHDRTYQVTTQTGKTAEVDLTMLYTNFSESGDGQNVVMFIAFGAVYYHIDPFRNKPVKG